MIYTGCIAFITFKPNGISQSYQLDQSISILRVVGLYFSFLLEFQKNILQANSGDADQTPHNAASDLGLHCLYMSHITDASLK